MIESSWSFCHFNGRAVVYFDRIVKCLYGRMQNLATVSHDSVLFKPPLWSKWRENNTTDGFDPLYFFNFSGWIKTDLRSVLNEWMIEPVVLMHFWLKLLISLISCMNICTPNLLQTADSQQLSKSVIDMLLGINIVFQTCGLFTYCVIQLSKFASLFFPHLVSNCPA